MFNKKSFLFFFFSFCSFTASAQTPLQEGIWRAILLTKSGEELPFNFSVKNTSISNPEIEIRNAEERIKVEDLQIREDSLFFRMPLFDSEFKIKYSTEKMEGKWIKHYANYDTEMPFRAEYGKNFRFHNLQGKEYNIKSVRGKYAAHFESDSLPCIAEIKQNKTYLSGTFLTSSGDYRYLEGDMWNDTLSLSCFDGCHAFIFKARLLPEKKLNGLFYSGFSYVEKWNAAFNPEAQMADPYSLTYLNPGYNSIAFTFPDPDGVKVSLNDERFKNKVVILQIMGSWCPNCMDETRFMVPFYNKYHSKGLEIIGLAYERSADFQKAMPNVVRMKNTLQIPYTVLIAGSNNKAEASKTLPMLNEIFSFPTTIIIDKKGKVRKIHTGFSGPGTGEHYTHFTNEFEDYMLKLLQEK